MWGAKSGKEQLAPFPEPTHAAGFACAVPNSAKQCVVGFTTKEAFDKAHKMVRCWPYFNCSLHHQYHCWQAQSWWLVATSINWTY